jgi:hypothetical protein
MDSSKRVASGGICDRLPEEVISLIASKVVETSEAPLEDLHSLRLCNQRGHRRAMALPTISTSRTTTRLWFGECAAYLQTIDWLLGVSNGQALFINGMCHLCTGRPGGVALLERVVDEGDLQAAYMLVVLNYYKHDATDHVLNLICCVYGEVPLGSQVAGRLWSDEGIHDEDEARIARVRY